ncbi:MULTISPECIES: lipase family protein [unclassified Microcoleus]|uniref:lipase family protein n=1 Tax=unclassified Microcoleus TaxID=2642155 RepID=UPI002FCF429F
MPKVPYNREISKLLTKCLKLAVEQYGKKDPKYDGSIVPPDGYTQIASFKRPEISNSSQLQLQSPVNDSREVYFGFALTSETNNIITLRGTQSLYEWITNLSALQDDYDSSDDKRGKIHLGFKFIYDKLSQQIREAARQFDTLKPCYVTGHSLGGALAVLAATDIAVHINGLKDQVQMYSYGGPRIGDPVFASFYNELIPSSYRVVNLADVVPVLPPTHIYDCTYQHVGQEWSYLWQKGDIGENHYLVSNYLPAVSSEVEKDKPLIYPC